MNQDEQLPPKYQQENVKLLLGSLIPILVTPIFWWLCSRSARHQKFVKLQKFTIINMLQGHSCAEICWNALVRYGIPWHSTVMQWVVVAPNVYGLSYEFYVPSTQAWYADIILRQHQSLMSFIVCGAPLKNQRGYESTRYQDRLYKPQGVDAYIKSPTVWIGELLFGSSINKKRFTPSEMKELKMARTNVLKPVPQQKRESVSPKKRKSSTPQVKPRQPGVKLGKTHS